MSVTERTETEDGDGEITVYCCDALMRTAYCPHCGKSMAVAEKANESPFPHRFLTYLHGCEDEDMDEMLEELDITEKDKVYYDVIGCTYEVELEYEITAKDGEVNIIAVDKIPLVNKEFEKDDLIVIKSVGVCVITTVIQNQIFALPMDKGYEKEEFEIFKTDVERHWKPII